MKELHIQKFKKYLQKDDMLTFAVLSILIMHDTIISDNVNTYKISGKDHIYIVYNIRWCNLKW